MIHNEWQFTKAAKEGSKQVACLPQDTGKRCLAVKVNEYTAYLGNEDLSEAKAYCTLDEAIQEAHRMQIPEVLVITGAEEWEF